MGFMGFRDIEEFLMKQIEIDVSDEWYNCVVDVLLMYHDCMVFFLCNFALKMLELNKIGSESEGFSKHQDLFLSRG